jgi:hypothetical protein
MFSVHRSLVFYFLLLAFFCLIFYSITVVRTPLFFRSSVSWFDIRFSSRKYIFFCSYFHILSFCSFGKYCKSSLLYTFYAVPHFEKRILQDGIALQGLRCMLWLCWPSFPLPAPSHGSPELPYGAR